MGALCVPQGKAAGHVYGAFDVHPVLSWGDSLAIASLPRDL